MRPARWLYTRIWRVDSGWSPRSAAESGTYRPCDPLRALGGGLLAVLPLILTSGDVGIDRPLLQSSVATFEPTARLLIPAVVLCSTTASPRRRVGGGRRSERLTRIDYRSKSADYCVRPSFLGAVCDCLQVYPSGIESRYSSGNSGVLRKPQGPLGVKRSQVQILSPRFRIS